jgi:hypothetical protein
LQSLPEHDTTPDVNRRREREKSSEKRNNSGNRGSSANRSGKIRDKIIEESKTTNKDQQLETNTQKPKSLTENSSNKQKNSKVKHHRSS